MHQEFDFVQFNGLCLSIEGQEMDFAKSFNTYRNRYEALCDFILEIATELIAPDLADTQESGPESITSRSAAWRYRYFFSSVIKANIWHDHSQLFESLKARATRFMGDISHVCRMRHEELAAKDRGNELLSFLWYCKPLLYAVRTHTT